MRYVRTYPEQLPILRDLLSTIETQVLIINGAKNPVVPQVSISTIGYDIITDAGQFIWEDAADAYAALVASWWTEGSDNASLDSRPLRHGTPCRIDFRRNGAIKLHDALHG
jgi:hypothetical protein